MCGLCENEQEHQNSLVKNTSTYHLLCNIAYQFISLESFFLKVLFIFLERGKGRERERERNIHQLPLACPQPGTWPKTQRCALTRNQISDLSIHRPALNPLNHTSRGYQFISNKDKMSLFC